ncbi:MAG: YihY/virulence factor BrkB family protein [Kouleothrix sp.]|nr:YihY/virulence factor BrkB family protein [Kouleothrix sp.]
MGATNVWSLLKETVSDWSEDRAPRLAAALAYYTVFALAPLVIIVVGIVGLVFDPNNVQGQIVGQIGGLIGQENGQAIGDIIRNASESKTGGTIATIIGLVTLVLSAGGVFGELQDSLNTIWEVKPKPGRGIWGTIKDRFLSFTMILGIGFLLLVSLIISAALGSLGNLVAGQQFGESIVWKIVNFVVSFGVITLLFAMIYKFLPDVKVAWSDVWIGAAVTALLFTIGKAVLSWYLTGPGATTTYGAAGAFVALLLWVYYSAQILFFGAEFTQVYARAYGSKIQPSEDAVPVTEDALAQQGIPRRETLERATQLRERQVGGGDVDQASDEAPRPAEPAAGAPARPAGAGAVTAFFLGLLLGRRQRSPHDNDTGAS